MTLPVTLRPRAEADLADAYAWYEERLPGLGAVFLRAADACFARLERQPEAHAEVSPRVRRAVLRRFPYAAFYVIRRDRIDVLAVYHARRRPLSFRR